PFLVMSVFSSPTALHSFPTRRSSDLALIFLIFVLFDFYHKRPHFFDNGFRSMKFIDITELELFATCQYKLTTSRAFFSVCNDTGDRKSTRLNSSHVKISYAVFCLKKK